MPKTPKNIADMVIRKMAESDKALGLQKKAMGATFPNNSIFVTNRTNDGERSMSNVVTRAAPPDAKNSFIPSHITGEWGHRNMGSETGTMHTPALPKNAAWQQGYEEVLFGLGLMKRASTPLETIRKTLEVPEVMDFLKAHPNPPDSKLHDWTDSNKIETDDAEAAAYQLATEMVKFLHDGKSVKDKKKESDFDSGEIAKGIKVEKEHTSNETIAKRIAMDHLTEIPDYYTRLLAMEEAAKKGKK